MDTTLVILAAGLGSRFGGGSAKQVAAIGENGEIIADYSVFDAIRAGFTKIVYVIKEDMEKSFAENVSSKIKGAKVCLAFQKLDDLPLGFSGFNRERPWGTAHALWAARHEVNEPFMMIYADDFYGKKTFADMNKFLIDTAYDETAFAMAGYKLEKTLSEHGSVARGVCTLKDGYLVKIDETLNIHMRPDGIAYPIYGNENNYKFLPFDSIVSMGAFASKPSIFMQIEKGFAEFLTNNQQNLKAEYYAPVVISDMINNGQASVKVVEADEQWYGITHADDKPIVQAAIAKMTENGVYPKKLF